MIYTPYKRTRKRRKGSCNWQRREGRRRRYLTEERTISAKQR